ncbi:MAG: DUF362 domain-containing protein [Candidatus Pacearchaeota archaeon]|jgi:uncharacterized protein (DUF362 family)
MKTVSIIKHENYKEKELLPKVKNILQSSGILNSIHNKKVLLKPNCTGIFSSNQAKTTNPIFFRCIIKLLIPITKELVVGESSSVNIDTIDAYKKTGIFDECKKLNIKMIDFKKSKYKKIKINGKILNSIELPEEVFIFDIVISIAKLKTNYVSTISCSIKNLKGLLKDKDKKRFHEIGLSKAVYDLSNSINNVYGIIDGIIGNELYEPKRANIILASKDIFSLDYISARIMRISPKKIEHLKLINKNKIKIIGERVKDIKISFKKDMPGLKFLEREFKVTIINNKSCSNCIGALYLSLKKTKKIDPNLLNNLKLNIGKNNENNFEIINFGNCSYKSKKINIPGCPPRTSEFIKNIRRIK